MEVGREGERDGRGKEEGKGRYVAEGEKGG